MEMEENTGTGNDGQYAEVIREYNEIMCGQKTRFSNLNNLSQKALAAVGRYAFSYYMGWSPFDVEKRLTPEILDKLHLKERFLKIFKVPTEIMAGKDMYYYAHLLYPDIIPYSQHDAVLRVYSETLEGKRKSLTPNFFSDADAKYRAVLCTQYALRYLSFQNMPQLYHFFSGIEGRYFLEDRRLGKAIDVCYGGNPLIMVHDALGDENNELWYNYYLFAPEYIPLYLAKVRGEEPSGDGN